MDPMAAIRETFFQECEEGLCELETGLLKMAEGDRDGETVNAVFRAVHSIKGGAGAFGLDALVRFAHVFETTLDDLRSGRLVADGPLVAVMLRATDGLADLVTAARGGREADDLHLQELVAELKAVTGVTGADAFDDDDGMGDFEFQPLMAGAPLAGKSEPDAVDVDRAWTLRFAPHAALYAKANDPLLLFRELATLGTLTADLDSADLPSLDALDPDGAYLRWTLTLVTAAPESAIREVFDFVEGDCELSLSLSLAEASSAAADESGDAPFDIMALIAMARASVEPSACAIAATSHPSTSPLSSPSASPAAEASRRGEAGATGAGATIRVDLERVDRLIDLVGELVINQAMLNQRISEAGLAHGSAATTALEALEQLTREIQDSVMAIRAQPVKSVFQRMPRLVRETAAMVGKQVRLVTEGENTEVDKTVIERLAEPLTHMIRNSIDHGIESADTRRAAGKPTDGVVRLTALHRSGRIVLEVADDGAGINRPRVRQIAIERGLIAPEAALSDEETDNLIFMAGFSTAETVSDVSGRGVGMDVVRRSIQALGGRISIASRPGQGSTFTLSLPLTLAVLDGMVVTVCGQTLVTPLTAMIETLQPKAAQIYGLGDGRVVRIRDAYMPLIDVGVALGYRSAAIDPTAGVALLVEAEGGARSALLVDAIQGQRQVVIKSLEANFQPVPGIAAATILGDGRVALILDVDAVVARRGGESPPLSLAPLSLAPVSLAPVSLAPVSLALAG